MKIRVIVLSLLIPLLFSCAPATGVGEFSPLELSEEKQAGLAIFPVRGRVEPTIKNRLVNNLNLTMVRNYFESLDFVTAEAIKKINIPPGTQLSTDQLKKIATRTDGKYLLEINVEEFGEEQFTEREQETLYYYRTRMKQSTYRAEDSSKEAGNDTPVGPPEGPGRRRGPDQLEGNGEKTGDYDVYEQVYESNEIPVTVDRVRVVMLVSARIYNLEEKQLIWSGRRLERAEGDLARTSPIELTERVLKRLGDKLSRAITGQD
ncbi:MAG: hypothetical protein ACQEP7_03790 [bacterium]